MGKTKWFADNATNHTRMVEMSLIHFEPLSTQFDQVIELWGYQWGKAV